MTYLGIDLGTSGLKVLLIDGDQNILASATSPLKVTRPEFGWSEQNPVHWITATQEAISDLRKKAGPEFEAVRGIGLSGHMHGATLIDEGGEVLRPCILWNDTRSGVQAAQLDADPSFREITGNIVFPGFTAPKLAWIRDNEPAISARIAKVLLPKDYLRYWLTGEYVSEMSDAAGTSWLDTKARQWSETLLEKTGLTPSHMPALVEGSESSGELRKELRNAWGISGTVTVAGGGGDNAASAIGMGTVNSGDAFLSLGTSGVIFVANDRYRPNPQSAVHAFCHALPETWHQMGVILSATDCLNWLSGITGRSQSELTSALPEQLAHPSRLSFLPYLSGERTPHNDAGIRGAFVGLDHAAGVEVLTSAVLEGVSFAFRDCLEVLKEAGTEIDRVTAIGGGARSRYWLMQLATVLGVEVDIPAAGDFGAAFGAARLGILASEKVSASTICTKPAIDETILPAAAMTGAYDDAYRRYRALYPAIRKLNTPRK